MNTRHTLCTLALALSSLLRIVFSSALFPSAGHPEHDTRRM
jgi:hypothetical protein